MSRPVMMWCCVVCAVCCVFLTANQSYRTQQTHASNLWMESNQRAFLESTDRLIKTLKEHDVAMLANIEETLRIRTSMFVKDTDSSRIQLMLSAKELDRAIEELSNLWTELYDEKRNRK